MTNRPIWACDDHKILVDSVDPNAEWRYIGPSVSEEDWLNEQAEMIRNKLPADFEGHPYYDSLGPCGMINGRLYHTSECSGVFL